MSMTFSDAWPTLMLMAFWEFNTYGCRTNITIGELGDKVPSYNLLQISSLSSCEEYLLHIEYSILPNTHTHTHTKYSAWWVFSALFLAVPGSALVCHYLPFHKLPHTSTDWPKCFCIYRLKCSKAISGWTDRWTGGRSEISGRPYSKSTCGANK